jgi:hypothetical protein
MKTYYVEVSLPPYPNKGMKYRIMTKYIVDALSPSLVKLFSVQGEDKQDAIAKVICGEAKVVI